MSAFVNKCPNCGTRVKLGSRSLDGKKARCPRCAAAFRIKAPPEREARTQRKPPSVEFGFLRRLTDEDLVGFGPVDDEADDRSGATRDEPRAEAAETERDSRTAAARPASRRRKESSSRTDLLIGAVVIGAGLLLVAGVGLIGVRLLPELVSGGTASRLAWMPDDLEGFLEVRLEELWLARALRPVRESEIGLSLRESMDQLLRPLAFGDIERMAVGFPAPGSPQPQPVFVLYGKSSFDEEALASQAADFEPAAYGNARYYIARPSDRAVFFAASDVIVSGSEEQIKAAIDRAGVCAAADEFELSGSATIVFAARNPQRFGTPSLQPIAGHEAGLAADATGLSRFGFAANVDSEFTVWGTLVYDSADAAEALVDRTRDHVAKQLTELEFERSERLNTDPTFKLNVYGVKQYLTAQLELLRSVEVRHSGSNVDVELTVPAFLFEHSFEFFEVFAVELLRGVLDSGEEGDDADPEDPDIPQE